MTASKYPSRTTTAFWVFAALDSTVGLLMLHFGHPGIAAVNLLAVAALSWAGYLSGQNDRHHATQDRDYLTAEGERHDRHPAPHHRKCAR